MKAGETWRQALVVENTNATPLLITNILLSCDCLTVEKRTDRIEPGGRGEIEVTLKPPVAGTLEYELAAQTSAGERRWVLRATVAAAPRSRVRDLYVAWDELRRRWERGETYTLVDVRLAEAFDAAHVPGALNIPRSAVRMKNFLRETPVVLVDDGWGDPVLEDECVRLRKAGFASVHILHGGVNAWFKAGGALEGREAAAPAVDKLDGQSFLAARGYDDWIIVAADEDEWPNMREQLPECVRLSCRAGEEEAFSKEIAKRVKQLDKPARVLVLTRAGQDYPRLDQVLHGRVDAVFFYLEHGWLGLGRAMDVQTLVWQGATTRRTTGRTTVTGGDAPKPCGSCGGRKVL